MLKTTIPAAAAAPSELSEAEVIRRAQQHDSEAFEFLYHAHHRRVYSLCLRLLKNTADAEDFTQQAFLQAFRKIHTFRGESGFGTWLHRVTVNIVLMHLRRRKPVETQASSLEPGDDEKMPHDFVDPDSSLLSTPERLTLESAIEQLPPGCKKLVMLHDVLGYKHHEIAGMLNCSTGGSKSQLHKARKRLRQILTGEAWPDRSRAYA